MWFGARSNYDAAGKRDARWPSTNIYLRVFEQSIAFPAQSAVKEPVNALRIGNGNGGSGKSPRTKGLDLYRKTQHRNWVSGPALTPPTPSDPNVGRGHFGLACKYRRASQHKASTAALVEMADHRRKLTMTKRSNASYSGEVRDLKRPWRHGFQKAGR